MIFPLFLRSGFRIAIRPVSVLFLLFIILYPVSGSPPETGAAVPVTCITHDNDRAFGEQAVRIIRENYPRLCASLEITKPVPVQIIVAGSENEFRRFTGGSIPDWGIAAADAQSGRIFLKSPRIAPPEGSLHSIVVHELSHVILAHAVNGAYVPRWFEEGLAQYHSHESGLGSAIQLSGSLLLGQVLDLDEIDDVLTFRREKAALAYREALSAVEFLTDRYGDKSLARLTGALAEGRTMEESIRSVTGLSKTGFENGWLHYIKNKYRWYAIIDMRFILSFTMTTLFIAAYLNKRRQAGRQKKIWEKEAEHEIFFEETDSTSD